MCHRWRLVVLVALVLAPGVVSSRRDLRAQAAPDQVTFRMIVVSSAGAAQQVLDRVRAGADFASLARTDSIDPSADAGGLIGPVSRAELRPELDRSALLVASA